MRIYLRRILEGLYVAAKQAVKAPHRELMDLNPSAARSLGEGMEETLTVHRLRLPIQLRKTMGEHQRDRIRVLDCRAGLQKRETLARRRQAGALGGLGPLDRREAVTLGHGLQTDSITHQGTGSSDSFQASGCQTKKGVVEWVTRESRISTEFRAFPVPGRGGIC